MSWALIAVLANLLPVAARDGALDAEYEALAQRVFGVHDAGKNTWQTFLDATSAINAANERFSEEFDRAFQNVDFCDLTMRPADTRLAPEQRGQLLEMQRRAVREIAETGVWGVLAESALAEQLRGPICRSGTMGEQMATLSSARTAALIGVTRLGFAAEDGDWSAFTETILANVACARAAESGGALVNWLLAVAIDRRTAAAFFEHVTALKPTAAQCRAFDQRLVAAHAHRLSAADVAALEGLFWLDHQSRNGEFATAWPVRGVRRVAAVSWPIGRMNPVQIIEDAQRTDHPLEWLAQAALSLHLSSRQESRNMLRLGAWRLGRLLSEPRSTRQASLELFERALQQLPLRYLPESDMLQDLLDLFLRNDSWEEIIQAERHAVRLVLALMAYKADTGAFPARLESLTPRYLDTLPSDSFAPDGMFRYRRSENAPGFTLYSTGLDGKDDHGARAANEFATFQPEGVGTDRVFVPAAAAE